MKVIFVKDHIGRLAGLGFLLVLLSGLVAAGNEIEATDFHSNGDLIQGWWLRDPGLQRFAEWRFIGIPAGTGDPTLEITALATDRENGGRGFPTLPSRTRQPWCSGLFRAERISPDTNVAFRKDSLVIHVAGANPFRAPQNSLRTAATDSFESSGDLVVPPGRPLPGWTWEPLDIAGPITTAVVNHNLSVTNKSGGAGAATRGTQSNALLALVMSAQGAASPTTPTVHAGDILAAPQAYAGSG